MTELKTNIYTLEEILELIAFLYGEEWRSEMGNRYDLEGLAEDLAEEFHSHWITVDNVARICVSPEAEEEEVGNSMNYDNPTLADLLEQVVWEMTITPLIVPGNIPSPSKLFSETKAEFSRVLNIARFEAIGLDREAAETAAALLGLEGEAK